MAEGGAQNTNTVGPDVGNALLRRSSSQTSHASSNSGRVRTVRGPKRHGSRTTLSATKEDDPSLTSFPSLTPDPDDASTSLVESPSKPSRTVSQKVRDRKATLAGLTSVSSTLGRHNALFDDSPRSSLDVPGSLHLANDEHIERIIARTGALKLIRQYAQDLAHRDSEISALRIRADYRERELKRLLREADVPSAEVEKRLLRLDMAPAAEASQDGIQMSNKISSAVSLDGMMNEAMTDEISHIPIEAGHASTSAGLPHPPLRKDTGSSTIEPVQSGYESSRNTSRASSIISQNSQDVDATLRPKIASANPGRLSGLQNIFQPPANNTGYFIGGANKSMRKSKAVDELSVRSNQSGKSFSSWTRIFGGAAPSTRSRASSDEQRGTTQGDTASASLTKVRTNPSVPATKSTLAAKPMMARPQNKRTVTASRLSTSPNHARKDSNASSLPPTVELDSMIESSQLPPTMSSHNTDGLLTDRFGFIYDRKRKRHHLQVTKHAKNKPSATESIASFRSGDIILTNDQPNRPDTPASVDEDSPKKTWTDYLMPASSTGKGRPRELLSHTPSAGAVVTVSSADAMGTITPPRQRDSSAQISTLSQKALPSASSITQAQPSTINVTSAEFAHDTGSDIDDSGPSKLLLDQLTELHDTLQAERVVKWNDFLRRVRSERANNPDRRTNNAPEADLVNGELIGIATLGRSSRTKSKYMHFKNLVLAGIPVSLRPKVWAECSGASSLRIPGYYEDLVTRSEEGVDIDEEIASQIKADVKRTLRDNIFFRAPDGPGVQRLSELLRAYSLHNPRIGYCQGMNLITASLLLICATPEDCFWLLVAIIDHILPSGYFDQSLLVARADQIVLRQYVAEVLPKLDSKLLDLGVELEACTFHWFLSLYTGVLTGGEALYRVWDVVLCLNSSDAVPIAFTNAADQASNNGTSETNITTQATTLTTPSTTSLLSLPSTPTGIPTSPIGPMDNNSTMGEHDGTSSPFLFQLSLALLKLNEASILALDSPAQIYTYLNHNMTAHNITIDALVNAGEMLRSKIKRNEVLERRRAAVRSIS